MIGDEWDRMPALAPEFFAGGISWVVGKCYETRNHLKMFLVEIKPHSSKPYRGVLAGEARFKSWGPKGQFYPYLETGLDIIGEWREE